MQIWTGHVICAYVMFWTCHVWKMIRLAYVTPECWFISVPVNFRRSICPFFQQRSCRNFQWIKAWFVLHSWHIERWHIDFFLCHFSFIHTFRNKWGHLIIGNMSNNEEGTNMSCNRYLVSWWRDGTAMSCTKGRFRGCTTSGMSVRRKWMGSRAPAIKASKADKKEKLVTWGSR